MKKQGCYYVNKDGTLDSESFHAELLSGITEEGKRRMAQESYERAIEYGIDPEIAARAFPTASRKTVVKI